MQYQQSMKEFEQFLQANAPQIPSFHPYFATAFWEMLLYGGKRFRPNLLLAVVSGLRPIMTKNAFLPALALECLHTYSLIHDDLPCMDNASLRRGKPTLHTTYDEVSATLVGDGLNTYAFYLLSCAKLDPSVQIQLVKELAYVGGIGGMVIGQALDCHFENQALPLEQLQAGKPTRNDGQKNSYVNLLGLAQAKELLQAESSALATSIEAFPKPIAKNLSMLLGDYFKEIV